MLRFTLIAAALSGAAAAALCRFECNLHGRGLVGHEGAVDIVETNDRLKAEPLAHERIRRRRTLEQGELVDKEMEAEPLVDAIVSRTGSRQNESRSGQES